jgi:hypothetical protein
MAQRYIGSYHEGVNREAVRSLLNRIHHGIKHTKLVESQVGRIGNIRQEKV